MESDPHLRRLAKEHTRLVNLAKRSQGHIEINPVEVVPGMPPDKYIITFNCKGVERVTDDQEPVVADKHRVSMYITRDFPQKEPQLLWLTPIWHPNISHEEPRHVCINKKNYFPAKGLDDFVLMLGEMVQYKRYHALPVDPLPYDMKVAEWVLNYAEPRGIVGPDKPFDSTRLGRLYGMRTGRRRAAQPRAAKPRAAAPTDEREKLVLGVKRTLPGPSAPAARRIRKPGINLGD